MAQRELVARVIVQLTRKGTYLTVQDKHGAILASAKWERRVTYDEASDLLRADGLVVQAWRKPRPGVLVSYVRDGGVPTDGR